MAKSSTTLKKGDNLPGRGRSNRTIIIDAIRGKAMLGVKKTASNDQVSVAFFAEVAAAAFNKDDPARSVCIKLLADKGWASLKPESEVVEFDFDENTDPHIQATQIIKGMSEGRIPPDTASTLISSIKSLVDIEEFTSLKERIAKLEAALDGGA